MKNMNNTGKALIVEDDKLLALVEQKLLKKLGYEVLEVVKTGEEAINRVRALDPDFILMDMSLQGDLDGVNTVHKIRKFSSVPIIYLSGNTERHSIERAKKTDFIDYLIKPIVKKDLIEPLRKAMSVSNQLKGHGELSHAS